MKHARSSQAGLLRRPMFLLACAALCGACSTSPTSGRTQFNILPEPLETRVPDIRFEVHTLLTSKGEYCSENESPCAALEQAEKLTQRMAPMAERLGKLAVDLSPELAKRVPLVEVFVVAKDSPSVISSAGGKIAVSSSLAQLDLSDTDFAFALAREFGRLAAAHHRESTSAGLAVSLLAGSPLTGAYLATTILADLLFPMGTLFKLGISLIGSMGTEQLVEISQQEEADLFAGKLMLAAGYDLRELAKPHPGLEEGAARIGWLPRFVASRARVAAMAAPEYAAAGQPDPWPDEASTPVALAIAPDPWPDEAPLSVALAVTPDPWPDEAQETPGAPAEPPKTGPEAIAQLAAPGPTPTKRGSRRHRRPKSRQQKRKSKRNPPGKKARKRNASRPRKSSVPSTP
ncbi:MAG: M48 family metalloprotease [Rhodocyclales bacterium]|nr:M48 family metalloprotease [Rhodocyclales bacterium]